MAKDAQAASPVAITKSPVKRGRGRSSAAALVAANAKPKHSSKPHIADNEDFKTAKKCDDTLDLLCDFLPAFVWYTYQAIPQLISRLEIDNDDMWEMIRRILTKALVTYPAQAFWHLLGVLKSGVPERAARARLITDKLRKRPPCSGAPLRFIREAL